ncbi:MAG: PilW family protein [Steroidobacteraceae bacterium]
MRPQRGFSMVELMVAIVLALLLTGAVISVFIGSRSAYEATAGVGDMADSGRFALNLIGQSVRSAGNLACNSAMSATSSPLLPVTDINTNFAQGITGFEANGTGNGAAIALPAAPVPGAASNWTPNLDAAVTGATAGPVGLPVQGSDVLVVRSSVARVAPVYTVADAAPGAVNVSVTQLPGPPAPAMAALQYAAIADCTKSVIFQVAAIANGAPANLSLIGALPVGFSAGALVAPLTTTIYYIGVGSDGDSALFRLELPNGGAQELVPDVENMQLLYGIDAAGTQTAGAYVTAAQVGTSNVVSIQVALLVASPPGNKPGAARPPLDMIGTPPARVTVPRDNRSRKVFSAIINLRNAVN